MMWLFSSSSSPAPDAEEGNPTTVDEESTMEAPQKSYSATHDNGSSLGEMDGASCSQSDGSNASELPVAVNCRNGKDAGPTIIPLPTQNYQTNGSTEPHNCEPSTSRKRRGIIYLRRINPSDRNIIQTLHEKWFPVDYKPDFFDTLCNNTERIKMPGLNNCEPLYSCVACFKELDEDEFAYRQKRRREREEREASWSFWLGQRPCGNDGAEDGDDDDEFGSGSLLWEMAEDSDAMENGSAARNGSAGGSERSYQDATTTPDRSVRFQHPPATPIGNGATAAEDGIESGESALSIHHRAEREKLKRFYSNDFQHESSDSGGSCNNDTSSENGNRSSGDCKQQLEGSNHSDSSTEGPYYNDEGEQIVGCIVGSFLPSAMLANRHKSTLDEKPKRDETAQLLVPDCDLYPKMFYIMTLGTTREFRRCGLGSVLVGRVVEMIEGRSECGALYLHVIIYNEGAMRLYERLGFARVKEIKDYYTINGVHYACYLYARYFHGNRGHQSTLDVLYGIATNLMQKLSPFLSR